MTLRSVEQHLAAVLDGVTALPAVEVPLLDALDLAVAEDVSSPVPLPRFDNSAMDGYAVRTIDVAGATATDPVVLPVRGQIGAGHSDDGRGGAVLTLQPGTAAKIMTGAPMPAGADTVAPYEWTDSGTEQVRLDRAPDLGAHVRYAGEDVAVGEPLVAVGTVLGPRQLGLLAAVGRAAVRVRRRPRVVVLSTGSELVDPGVAPGDLAPDAIYDGNSYLLAAAVRHAGAEPVRVGVVPDAPEAFLAALRAAVAGADAVVTSGGISMGDFDVVKATLRGGSEGSAGAAGFAEVWFGGLAMQPGKPQGFGHLLDTERGSGADGGARRVPFFALPGNPVSSYISFEMFVRPALRRMTGLTPESRPVVRARLTHRVGSPPGRRQFLRGVLSHPEPGGPRSVTEVEPVGGSGSHLVGDLAVADALIVVPEDVTEVAAGELVDVVRLDAP